ncbi:MAG TPA: hypothetical protein VFF67_06075 [Thermoplasmata archaeon]|nr:hypothetical protein [Thermoplasmata archaeon]
MSEIAAFHLEDALLSWDSHVRGCRSCLRAGNSLCREGEYLSDSVTEARAAARVVGVEASGAGVGRGSLLRRTLLPFLGAA